MATDHFLKHSNTDNEPDWNFNLLFDHQPAVSEMVQQYSKVLIHPALYPPVPSDWLHSTILRVGRVSAYTEAEMLTVAEKIQHDLIDIPLPQLVFDSWWLWGGNVVLHISPDDCLTNIYKTVHDSLQRVVGTKRATKTPHGSFIAHTTLAYTKTHNLESELNRQLSKAHIPSTSFHAKNLSLIKQWPTRGHYEWQVVREIPLKHSEH